MYTKCIPHAPAQTVPFPQRSVMSAQRAMGETQNLSKQGLFSQLLIQGLGLEALPIPSPICEPLDKLVISLGSTSPSSSRCCGCSWALRFLGKTLLTFCRDWISRRTLGCPYWGNNDPSFLPVKKGNIGVSGDGLGYRTAPLGYLVNSHLTQGNRSSVCPHLPRPWS